MFSVSPQERGVITYVSAGMSFCENVECEPSVSCIDLLCCGHAVVEKCTRILYVRKVSMPEIPEIKVPKSY